MNENGSMGDPGCFGDIDSGCCRDPIPGKFLESTLYQKLPGAFFLLFSGSDGYFPLFNEWLLTES